MIKIGWNDGWLWICFESEWVLSVNEYVRCCVCVCELVLGVCVVYELIMSDEWMSLSEWAWVWMSLSVNEFEGEWLESELVWGWMSLRWMSLSLNVNEFEGEWVWGWMSLRVNEFESERVWVWISK